MNRILFLGDFFYDFDTIKDDIKEIGNFIKSRNYLTILNLECSLVSSESLLKKGGPNLCSSPITVDILKQLNVICVTMANNHSMDYGKEGLMKTISLLDGAGIAHVGAGTDLEQALEPAIFNLHDGIVLLNYGWDIEETVYAGRQRAGCAPRTDGVIVEKIRETRSSYPGYKIIVLVHMGFEFNPYPMPFDIDLAHRCIDFGADLVIGHHPHIIQPKEVYKGKNIYYSLGNFYFGKRRDDFTKTFHAMKVENLCDYGLGVEYDISSRLCKNIIFEYDKHKGLSHIKNDDCFVEDISEWDCFGEEYRQLCKKSSENWNPILGVDPQENRRLLRPFLMKRRIGKSISFMKKNTVGRKLYYTIKRIST